MRDTYFTPKILNFLFLGVASGIPFLLILSTLSVRLMECNENIQVISLFSLATIPYSLKFFWAWILDICYIPFFSYYFGLRRGLLVLNQLILFILILVLGYINLKNNLAACFITTVSIAFFSANQDLLIDILRVETLEKHEQNYATSINVVGYRLGMLVGGGGSLYIASFYPWHFAYAIVGTGLLICALFSILLAGFEKRVTFQDNLKMDIKLLLLKMKFFLFKKRFCITSFCKIHINYNFMGILIFIIFFKAIDTTTSFTLIPFLIEIGFEKIDIAKISGFFGVLMMCIGALLGGVIIDKIKIRNSLFICLFFQTISSISFIYQSIIGSNIILLYFIIGFKGVVSGLTSVNLLTFIGYVCADKNVASRIAFLTSYASLARVFLTALFGWLCYYIEWKNFYSLLTLITIPGFIMLIYTCNENFLEEKIEKQA